MSANLPVLKPARPTAPLAAGHATASSASLPSAAPAAEPTKRLQSGSACSTSWSAEEQAALETAMFRFSADKFQSLERCVRIAATLGKKGVRDVAMRLKWMDALAARKRQIADSDSSKQRQQQQFRRERGQSIFNIQPRLPVPHMGVYAHPGQQLNPHFDDHGSASVGVVGGPVAQLLEQNYAVLNQFKQNMAQFKVNENTDLLARFRDNILAILNQMSSMQGVMQQMPPLPVRMNFELAQNFLPKCASSAFPMGMPFMPPPMPGMMPGISMNGFMGPMQMPPGVPLSSATAPQAEGMQGQASSVVFPPPLPAVPMATQAGLPAGAATPLANAPAAHPPQLRPTQPQGGALPQAASLALPSPLSLPGPVPPGAGPPQGGAALLPPAAPPLPPAAALPRAAQPAGGAQQSTNAQLGTHLQVSGAEAMHSQPVAVKAE